MPPLQAAFHSFFGRGNRVNCVLPSGEHRVAVLVADVVAKQAEEIGFYVVIFAVFVLKLGGIIVLFLRYGNEFSIRQLTFNVCVKFFQVVFAERFIAVFANQRVNRIPFACTEIGHNCGRKIFVAFQTVDERSNFFILFVQRFHFRNGHHTVRARTGKIDCIDIVIGRAVYGLSVIIQKHVAEEFRRIPSGIELDFQDTNVLIFFTAEVFSIIVLRGCGIIYTVHRFFVRQIGIQIVILREKELSIRITGGNGDRI